VDDLRVIDILIFKGRAEYKRKKKLENYCYKIKKKDLLFFINFYKQKKNEKPDKKRPQHKWNTIINSISNPPKR
jgi:hypothetical protein